MASAKTGSSSATALVIFGITGDLARKMTFRALYRLESRGLLDLPVVGVARGDWDDDVLRSHARQAIGEAGEAAGDTVDRDVLDRLLGRMVCVTGDYDDPGTFRRLHQVLGSSARPVFYLEIPPSLFAPVVVQLADAGLVRGARVVVEKPFGHDLESARELNARLHEVLTEDQILRVDHFLGKEPVLDVQYLRFANSIFEPVWNRHHIAAVQVTMAEDFGVEDRGGFYDAVGAMRDVVQNHLLQVLALVAMEPPAGSGDQGVLDQKVDVFRAMASVDPARVVRGQYRGYLDVAGVAHDSDTETFVALRVDVDNWRWSGVPFFLRAGKSMARRVTEVRIVFRRPPRLAFLGEPTRVESGHLVLRIDPDPGLQLVLLAKDPARTAPRRVPLELAFADALGPFDEPYERLLHAALLGDRSLFVREDAVEETWRILQPLVDEPPPVVVYEPGSWGPPAADDVVRGFAGWSDPWLTS